VKKRELEKKLKECGWYLKKHGGCHDIWSNGNLCEPIPSHAEINELLAKKNSKESNQQSRIGNFMELEGKIWKNGKHWLVEVPTLDVMTQATSAKNAKVMIADAIKELIEHYFPDVKDEISISIESYEHGIIGVSASQSSLLLALSLKRQREMHQSTVRQVTKRLGSSSPNAYARYEKGRTRISLDQYERLLKAVNPKQNFHLRVV
jgi:hypothetical protein